MSCHLVGLIAFHSTNQYIHPVEDYVNKVDIADVSVDGQTCCFMETNPTGDWLVDAINRATFTSDEPWRTAELVGSGNRAPRSMRSIFELH